MAQLLAHFGVIRLHDGLADIEPNQAENSVVLATGPTHSCPVGHKYTVDPGYKQLGYKGSSDIRDKP